MKKEYIGLSTSIADFPFSIRTYNCLRRAKTYTLMEVLRVGPKTLMQLPSFGKKCRSEIVAVLEGVLGSLGKTEVTSLTTEIRAWAPFFESPENIFSMATSSFEGEDGFVLDSGNASAFDPAVSPLAILSIKDLPLSTRTQNVLSALKIKNVHELVSASPQTIFSSSNCGRKTIGELALLVEDYVESLPITGKAFYAKPHRDWRHRFQLYERKIEQKDATKRKDSNYFKGALNRSEALDVMQLICEFLEGMNSRNGTILVKRMGLAVGTHRKTLEAVGRDTQLTRERVRQIVDKSIEHCARTVRTRRPDVFGALLAYTQRAKVASVEELIHHIENLGDSKGYDIKACIRMLLLGIAEKVKPLDGSNQLWSASKEFTPNKYKQILKTAKRVLMGIPQKLDRVALEVARDLRHTEDEHIEVIKKILRTPSSALRVESTPDGEIICPPHQNLPDQRKTFIYNYIREQGVPVHMKELFTAVQDSAPELVPDSPKRRSAISSIESLVDRDPRFAWAGSSTWGLTEWGYLTQERTFRAVVLELLRSSNEHLSPSQITKLLSHLYRLSSASVPAVLRADEGVAFGRDSENKWYVID